MADKTSGVNAGRQDHTDTDLPAAADPFAELTRIMGFDPRKADGARNAVQASSEEDFKIDLEEELMREFGDEEPAEQVVAVAPEPEPEPAAPAFAVQAEEEFPEAVALETAAEEAAVDEPVAEEVAPEPAPAPQPVYAQPAAEAEDLMAAELEPQAYEEEIPVIKLSPVAPVPEPAVEEVVVASAPDDAVDDAELEAEFNALLGNSEHQEILDTSAEKLATVAQTTEQGAQMAHQAAVSIPAPEDDLSVEFGFTEPTEALDRVSEAEVVELTAEETEELPAVEAVEEAEEVVAAAQEEVEPAAEVKAQEPAAAEEDDPFAMLAAMAQKYRVSEPNDSWRTTTPVFSRATPQLARVEPTLARAEPAVARVEPTIARVVPQPAFAEPQVARVEPRAPVIEAQPARIETPQTVYSRPAVAAPAPEIETIDVPDRAVAVADDLDIPELELAEEPPVVAQVDDLDAEFNNLLQQMSTPAPASASPRPAPSFAGVASRPAAPAYQPQPSHESQAYGYQPAAAPQQSYAQSQPAAQSYGQHAQATAPAYHERAEASYNRPAPAQAHHDDDIQIDLTEDDLAEAFDDFDTAAMDDFDLDGGFEDDDVAPNAYQQPAYQQPKRPGLLIAAIIGGVAILGVAGAVAISMMGDAQGSAPEMVKADQAPFKVRPENPGGTVQPNQESAVYDTVARTGGDAAPQDKLVTNTEEPIDLPDQLPQNGEDDLAMSDEGAKSEDRIAPTAAEESQPADGESLAVAPRKVRTMVVKPDGTLAPRDEVEPQAQNETAPAPAADEVASAIDADDQPAQPAQEQQAAAAQPENVAQEQTASIQPQPAVEGGWTMQIASESSEAAAKATYQKMLGRYGNVLDGKGVNIIKADVEGKGTFWRIRIPAESRDAAAGMCNSFKSAGGKCFVTKS